MMSYSIYDGWEINAETAERQYRMFGQMLHAALVNKVLHFNIKHPVILSRRHDTYISNSI